MHAIGWAHKVHVHYMRSHFDILYFNSFFIFIHFLNLFLSVGYVSPRRLISSRSVLVKLLSNAFELTIITVSHRDTSTWTGCTLPLQFLICYVEKWLCCIFNKNHYLSFCSLVGLTFQKCCLSFSKMTNEIRWCEPSEWAPFPIWKH